MVKCLPVNKIKNNCILSIFKYVNAKSAKYFEKKHTTPKAKFEKAFL